MAKKLQALECLILGIVLALSFVGCTKQEAERSEEMQATSGESRRASSVDPAGIYLAMGGQAYIEIARDASNNLMIKGSSFRADLSGYETKWQASFKGQHLILVFEQKWRGAEYDWETGDSYELAPSSRQTGDWDLVQYIPSWRRGNVEEEKEEAPPLKQPIPSFLHRLDDKRVVEYFELVAGYSEVIRPAPAPTPELDVSRLMELASGLLVSYPDDLYVRSLVMDALIRKRDSETLKLRLTAWQEAYTTTDDPYLRKIFQEANKALHALELSAAGRNAYDFVAEVLGKDADLATRFQRFPKILDYEEYARPRTGLVSGVIANFLELQVTTKVFRVGAIFLMLEGKREEALRILAASYHLGKLLNQSDTLIGRLIGIAVRAISTGGLEIYALNCCETPGDFQDLWKTLEQLNRGLREPDTNEILSLLSPFASYFPEAMLPNIKEALVRHHAADARFQLLRMATAAKYRFVTEHVFPGNAGEFAPLLSDGPPKDPFSSESLKFIAAPEKFTCYSVGADEQDNHATVSYDPTNGTVSRGDIIVGIPHQREFPFPRNGVKAATADDLRRQFPNGLPVDPFANTRGKPLGISNTTPVYVYSYGPDTNEQWAHQMGERYVPEVLYDPTNGTVSAGDLFIAIPR